MRSDTRNKFLALGFDTDLINELEKRDLSVSGVRGLNRQALLGMEFTAEQATIIISKTTRQPISPATIETLLAKSGDICAFCADGNSTRPYQIHHIEEYHKTQDNSEANLLLVCPTHHVMIHRTHLATEDQLVKKRNWEALWQIASRYTSQSVAFPFSAFDALDYTSTGSITEIFAFASPRPSVCKQLFGPAIIDDAMRILEKENKIILSGESGSGKTSLAKAIAGHLPKHTPFTYTLDKDSMLAVQEVLLFLSMAVKPATLIIDNANALLGDIYTENILKAAQPDKKIIIVNTRSSAGKSEDVELHFLNAVYPVNWRALKSSVKTCLLAHEKEVVDYLTANGFDSGAAFPLGIGHFNDRLERVIDRYSEGIDTVWQFIFYARQWYRLYRPCSSRTAK